MKKEIKSAELIQIIKKNIKKKEKEFDLKSFVEGLKIVLPAYGVRKGKLK